jgi:hypothetical protein
MTFERLLLATLDLVGQQQRQERGVIESLCSRQCQSVRQRRNELAQLQMLEQSHQIRVEAHDGSSSAGVTVATGR